MKTFAEGAALLKAQDDIIEAAMEEKERIKAAMIDQFCPVKPGSIVEVNHGYAHEGKRIKVSSLKLVLKSWRRGDGFVAQGYVLKKDGQPGLNRAEHFAEPAKGAQ